MKCAVRITEIAILFILPLMVNAQSNCIVLKAEISGSYVGECKKGLANGNGEAKGEDYYKGEFSNGYPDGNGMYIWKDGANYKGEWKKGLRDGNGTYSFIRLGKDSTLVGKWKNDKYIGSANIAQYKIEYRNNIGRVSFMRVGDRPYVKYKFSRNGIESTNISNLLLQGSSGNESLTGIFAGFEQVTFPFKGKISFIAPNALMETTLNCELQFLINEPGSWVVTLFY
jgi:hypothetical protein